MRRFWARIGVFALVLAGIGIRERVAHAAEATLTPNLWCGDTAAINELTFTGKGFPANSNGGRSYWYAETQSDSVYLGTTYYGPNGETTYTVSMGRFPAIQQAKGWIRLRALASVDSQSEE